jgi:pyrroloquinoline quinone (PQQ) biosynthesis protein C
MDLVPISRSLDFEPLPMIHELVARNLAPPEYVDALQRYARTSPATRHALLELIAVGGFRNPRAAMSRFFREYYHYSRRFTRFLASVMAGLERPEHRAALVPNSAEEAGYLDEHHRTVLRGAGLHPADVAGPHPFLFRRFLVAIGLEPGDLDGAPAHVATATWIQSFQALCRSDEASAVAALGLATEGIVRGMYHQLLLGIRRAWPELSSRDRAFFELHALVDDDHALTLRSIAVELAAEPIHRRALAAGMLGALDARACFYDQMQLYLVAIDRSECAPH